MRYTRFGIRSSVLAACGVALVILAGVSIARAAGDAESTYADVFIDDIPHIPQKPDFCGEACIAMALAGLGRPIDQDAVFDLSGLDPTLGRGCYAAELNRAARALGFDTGSVWTRIAADHAKTQLEDQFAALHADLLAGYPSIVCMMYHDGPGATEHFRLVIGYDSATDSILYQEPAEDSAEVCRMARAEFIKLWPLKYDKQRWTAIRLRLKPGRLKLPQASSGHTRADFAQRVLELKRTGKLPKGFTLVIEPPFVVIGDESPERVQQRAAATIRRSVRALKRQYFEKDPKRIIAIFLFKDEPSYRQHCEQLFGIKPHTPFGFYDSANGVMIMNIATGGGTLVHEIVHPFVEANFPQCPAWFNEGLGSLYEQSAFRDGRIMGLTNWRLAGLQQAIRAERVPAFWQLINTTTGQFYNADRGTNYAQARYLCYYLQQHDLLEAYYHRFRREHAADPTGLVTLKQVLDTDDLGAFEQRWRQWVLKLNYP